MTGTFINRDTGTEHPNTRAGVLDAMRGSWDLKVRRLGHTPAWTCPTPACYRATCVDCGGEVDCFYGGTSCGAAIDMRRTPCPATR
jgi:hypothetical protein